MSKKTENAGFVCENCGETVLPLTNGSYRNHCSRCLCSKHVDIQPGDRQNPCGGIMEPVSVTYRPGKGWQIVHRCRRCGAIGRNKVAEDGVQPDNMELVRALSARPLPDKMR